MKVKSYKTILPQIKTFIFDVDGVLTDGKVIVTTEGEMYRSVDTKDGYAIKFALSKGYKIAIISGGTNEGVRNRFKALGVLEVYLGINKKIDAYQKLLKTHLIKPEEVLYIGDDIPDIPVMEKVGLSCCPADAVTDVKAIVDYVSHKKGGEGCVREVIEQVLRVQGNWYLDKKTK